MMNDKKTIILWGMVVKRQKPTYKIQKLCGKYMVLR